ncbi:uncharacterized protein [Amphiura filiformis]|uniref:uncharacterized protein n=1 Tax=Amphiura filiformis TaxID=82378 RepID=UPI003B225F01
MLPKEVEEVLYRDSMESHWSRPATNGKYNADELATDLKLLLECLKYHENNPETLKDGLLTVSSICLQNAQAQDYFRDSGGLNFVLHLLTTNSHGSIMESAMYTLGCATERNVFSQKRMCTKSVFRFLECKLVDKKASTKLKRTVAYLLLCLVSNNSAAQALINRSHCLDALLDTFRSEFPGYKSSSSSPSQSFINKSANNGGSCMELWKAVTSTLIGCVNNPQNDANQRECSSVFPVALNILSHTKDPQVIRLLASFLSLTADNNGRNQDRLGMLGGMDIIVNALQTVVETLLQEPSPDSTDAAMQLASLLVSCVTDNRWNKMTLAELRVVPLLVQLLALDVIETEVKLNIVLTLGHLTEGCESSQRQLVESDGLGLIVHTMTGHQDEEFTKAATYLLHTCVKVVNSSDVTDLPTDGQKAQSPNIIPTRRRKHADGRNQSMPVTKQPQNKSRKTSAHIGSDTDEEESVKSVTLKNKGIDSISTQEVDSDVETEMEQKGETENSCTTIEALYKEISTRKELECKLQKEIQARENVEAEKGKLEKREEERAMAENITKQKAEAITKELERQYLMTVNKQRPDLLDTPKKTMESKMGNSKSTDDTPSSNREVLILEKKVEELQKQMQEHITHSSDQHSTANKSISCASVISTKSVESQATIAVPTSPFSNSVLQDEETNDRNGNWVIYSSKKKRVDKRNERKEPMSSPQSTDMNRVSSRRSNKNGAKSQIQAQNQVEISATESSHKAMNTARRTHTPNIRRATKPHVRKSIFKLPLSTITKNQKTSTKCKTSNYVNKQSEHKSFDRKRSPTPRPTYAEEVLPYKQQKFGSPLVLPKHITSSASIDDEESDLESIITDLSDSYSVADSGVTWSDVLLKLPVRPVGRRSKACGNRGKSRQYDDKSSSILSSQSARSKRSFLVKYTESQPKSKERQSYTVAAASTPSSTTSVLNCPGCEPPVHRPLLTSRNFLYTLEKSRHTCPEHREIQKVIKQDIENRKKLQGKRATSQATGFSDVRDTSVYNYQPKTPSTRTASLRSHTKLTSSNSQMKKKEKQECTPNRRKSPMTLLDECGRPRRKRQEFSQEEEDNLITGVQKSGKHWNFILWSYKFKPGRTAVDLKDKYRRMQAQRVPGVLPRTPAQRKCKRQIKWN